MTARSSALRRRRKASLATRLRIAWVFIVIIIGAAVYAGYVLVTLPALRVQGIDIRIAGLSVTERDVRDAANIDRGANVWLLDTAKIARRIEAIPYVDAATVRRVLPARIAIDVSQREPAACVHSARQIVTIDDTRRILQIGCARSSAMHIMLGGDALPALGDVANAPALANLLADGRILQDANVAIHSIRSDRYGQLVAVESDGIELLLGSDTDLAQKAKLVAPIVAAARPGRSIRTVDLRAAGTPIVEFWPPKSR